MRDTATWRAPLRRSWSGRIRGLLVTLPALILLACSSASNAAVPSTPPASPAGTRATPVVAALPSPNVVAGAGSAASPSSTPQRSLPSTQPSPSSLPSPSPLPTPGPIPVPRNLVPSLARASRDLPRVYRDGCHLRGAESRLRECVYGDPNGSETIVLFGDSHAAQWFPALERIAITRGWRLVSLTKSACASADVAVWRVSQHRRFTECDTWRRAALRRIAKERPAIVVVANSRAYPLAIGGKQGSSAQHEDVWAAGLRRTLRAAGASSGAVVLLGDTPRLAMDPLQCLRAHRRDARACASPRAMAVATKRHARDRAAARATGALFVDPSPWICSADACPAIVGRMLVFWDTHHMTATFSRSLAPRLVEAMQPVLPSTQ